MSDVLIKVNNISKSYSQGDIEIKVLSNFSLTIPGKTNSKAFKLSIYMNCSTVIFS